MGDRGALHLRLTGLVRASPLLTRALEAAREVDAPDWLIGAGVLRDLVWDHVHGRDPAPPKDVDLVFFDAAAGSRRSASPSAGRVCGSRTSATSPGAARS